MSTIIDKCFVYWGGNPEIELLNTRINNQSVRRKKKTYGNYLNMA